MSDDIDRRIHIERTFLITKDDSDSIAWAKVYRRPEGHLWLGSLWVAGSERHKGYAAALLRAVLRECGSEPLYLEVAPYADRPLDSAALMAFYGRFGFVETPVPGIMHRPATTADLREALASYSHNQAWSGWMRYMFSKGELNADGTWTMPAWAVERWQRQMNTAYAELTEEEKKSDRAEADAMLTIVRLT